MGKIFFLITFCLAAILIFWGAGCGVKTNFHTFLNDEVQIKTEAGRLADNSEIKASIEKLDELIGRYNESFQSDKAILDNISENKDFAGNEEYFRARRDLIALAIEILEKAKECVALIHEGQKSEENAAGMDCLAQNLAPLKGNYQTKLQEVENLSRTLSWY